jgi:hypothetical protein
VNDTTQTNHTLDSNPVTFPLENMTMWADFTHDNEQNAVLAAMGVLRMDTESPDEMYEEVNEAEVSLPEQDSAAQRPVSDTGSGRGNWATGPGEKLRRIRPRLNVIKEMDPAHPDPNRKWVASRLVPFAARLVVEKLSCPSSPHLAPPANDTAVESVRVLLNDAILHIPGCSESVGKGVCTLEEFLESQTYARSGGQGEWEKCQEVDG